MTLLEWRPEYSIGIAEVDHEHRQMIELINSCHEFLASDRSPERAEAFLGEVFTGISAHFALEERQMQTRAYPQLADHKADHERLLDEIRDIMDEQAQGAGLDEDALAQRLAVWFGDHFRTHDARLHHFLADRR